MICHHLSVQPGSTQRMIRMREVRTALASYGLILYDILSYYIQPGFALERMLPSLESGACAMLPTYWE
jgi:hypothetical protein